MNSTTGSTWSWVRAICSTRSRLLNSAELWNLVHERVPSRLSGAKILRWVLLCGVFGARVNAQVSTPEQKPNGAMSMPMNMVEMNAASMYLTRLSSGTSVNPEAWPMPMLMKPLGSWNTMFMAQAFLNDTQQSGPRGGDKLYSTNWFMGNAEHRVSENGAFEVNVMLSLEPATITDRRYPLLFQTGETAFGKPITDGQHPHDFIMALGIHYVHPLGSNAMFDLYFAPVGDPALGPVAYPHRASAMELPEAPISHHWEDSTHIADDVITVGVALGKFKLEASGFHGAEPDEFRWNIDQGAIDSWSARLWYFPSDRWAAQFSAGRIAHPEALEPGDQVRTTASVAYSKPLSGGAWSTTAIWGRIHSTATQRNLDAYTIESLVPIGRENFITGRIDLVSKDELFAGQPAIEEMLNSMGDTSFRLGGYTFGYTRDVNCFRDIETGIGANVEVYSLPAAIKPYYGNHPVGGNVFVRFRLRRAS